MFCRFIVTRGEIIIYKINYTKYTIRLCLFICVKLPRIDERITYDLDHVLPILEIIIIRRTKSIKTRVLTCC